MSINIDEGPIDRKNSKYSDFLEDLQGNILNGHGRDHAVHLFVSFRIDKIADAKLWIKNFAATQITSAKKQFEQADRFKATGTDAGLFAHIAISFEGYAALGLPPQKRPSGVNLRGRTAAEIDYADAFALGLRSRRAALFDPPVSQWELGYQQAIHCLIILADDQPKELIAAEIEVTTSISQFADIVQVERGLALRRQFVYDDGPSFENIEHFGYVDGRSQPVFLTEKIEEESKLDGIKFWNPGAPLNLVLLADPNGKSGTSFGSFLVFRKLEQNVRAFREAERDLARDLGISEKRAGAMAVGRFRDGTPLVLQPGDGGEPIANDFNYTGDPKGLTCPFQAHVRKTNPRLESVGPFAKSEEEELGHRIARRAIPYGGPYTEADSDNLDAYPSNSVGLLFMCYQSDIWEQFEFIQRFWADNPMFLQSSSAVPATYDRTGLDCVIGQSQTGLQDTKINEIPEAASNWPVEWGKTTKKSCVSFAKFVSLKGGEYFFSPSLTFMKSL
jgi:Dyp-type peroxidase family